MQIKIPRLIILLLLAHAQSNAQVLIRGQVLSDTSARPVIATIATPDHSAVSNNNGEFMIIAFRATDTVKVFAIGFKTYKVAVDKCGPGNIVIRLKPLSIMLKDVIIRASRDSKRDSIRNRKEFEHVFNYKPPHLTDLLRSSPATPNVPFAFVNIDLGVLVGVLTRKSDPTYKLQQVLLQDEQSIYVSNRFNRTLVRNITHLNNDSLNKFMDRYYPSAALVKKSTDYELIGYIKSKLVEFRAGKQ